MLIPKFKRLHFMAYNSREDRRALLELFTDLHNHISIFFSIHNYFVQIFQSIQKHFKPRPFDKFVPFPYNIVRSDNCTCEVKYQCLWGGDTWRKNHVRQKLCSWRFSKQIVCIEKFVI